MEKTLNFNIFAFFCLACKQCIMLYVPSNDFNSPAHNPNTEGRVLRI